MFDYTLLHWTTFLTATVLLNVSPGPDIAFILGQSARHGRRAGFAGMFGLWTGAFMHVVLAAAGLSAILMASASAFMIVKWIGGGYLIWLGIQALRSDGGGFASDRGNSRTGAGAICRQGVLVCLLNPKVAIFFLAFLPQFVMPGAGPISTQLFLHGSLVIVVAALIEPWIVLASAWLADLLKGHSRIGVWLDRSLGALLVMFGLRLVFSERT